MYLNLFSPYLISAGIRFYPQSHANTPQARPNITPSWSRYLTALSPLSATYPVSQTPLLKHELTRKSPNARSLLTRLELGYLALAGPNFHSL